MPHQFLIASGSAVGVVYRCIDISVISAHQNERFGSGRSAVRSGAPAAGAGSVRHVLLIIIT